MSTELEIAVVAKKLARKIINDQQALAGAGRGEERGLEQVITTFFECQGMDDSDHDIFGELELLRKAAPINSEPAASVRTVNRRHYFLSDEDGETSLHRDMQSIASMYDQYTEEEIAGKVQRGDWVIYEVTGRVTAHSYVEWGSVDVE